MLAQPVIYRRALVTGGAGFIGSHLTRALLARGIAVTVLDDLSTGKRDNLPAGVDFVLGDVRDRTDVRRALHGAEVVFHEAARVSIRSSVEHFYDDAATNVMGTVSVLDACRSSNVHKFVLASSMAVYADRPDPLPIDEQYLTEPIAPYGVAKLASEKYCLNVCPQLGLKPLVLRYFNTYGQGQLYTPYVGVITIFIRMLLAGEPLVIFGDGEQTRDFVWVGDIVQANLRALDYTGAEAVFNVGSGCGYTVNRIAALVASEIDPAARVDHEPPHEGEIRNSIANIERAQRHLGYVPIGRLEDCIRELVANGRTRSDEVSAHA